MTHSLRLGLAAALLLAAASALAAAIPLPPPPTRWVTDPTGFLSEPARRSLDARLEAYERASGNQMIVYITPTTGDTPVEEWAARAFKSWGIGKRGVDNGVALFVFPAARKARVEVGYDLEDRVPDAVASRIIRDDLIPGIRAGNPDGAVVSATEALASATGTPLPSAPGGAVAPRPQPIGTGELVFWAVLGLVLLIILATHPRLAMLILYSIFAGGGRRGGGYGGGGFGGGGGGGGFSGGGGRSGGGGATGSW